MVNETIKKNLTGKRKRNLVELKIELVVTQHVKKAGLKKGDPRHVDHKDGNPRNNSKKNLRKISAKTNLRKR